MNKLGYILKRFHLIDATNIGKRGPQAWRQSHRIILKYTFVHDPSSCSDADPLMQDTGYHDAETNPYQCLPQLCVSHPLGLHEVPAVHDLTFHRCVSPLSDSFEWKSASHPLIPSKNLQATHMCVLAILVILHNLSLHKKSTKRLPINPSTHMVKWNINPSFRLCKI